MSDSQYFYRGKIQQLREEMVIDLKRDPKFKKKCIALKKVVANMTMGNDMAALFADVASCSSVPNLEVKKMVYLYMVNYAKSKPEMAILAINGFIRDIADSNPFIRGLALRTMGYIHVDEVIVALTEPLGLCLEDKDFYVVKTACIAIAKVYIYDMNLAISTGLVDKLRNMVNHQNSMVVANTCAALVEMAGDGKFHLNFNMGEASKLIIAMSECTEWGQAYILEALMFVVPHDQNDAEMLAERIVSRLSHSNSAIILTAVKVIIYLINYIALIDVVQNLFKKLGPPLITLLHSAPEIQYVALRNILLIIQKYPPFLCSEIRVFFCKYNDPIYVKLTKLEVLFKLATEDNIEYVLPELAEYATEIDVDFVRRAVRSIGRCAIKIEKSSDSCMEALITLIETKVTYVVQEAIIVIKDIFRKYPNRYESIIKILCDNLDTLDQPEAKASMIWIIGQYGDRIDNAHELLEMFFKTINEDTAEVQLAMLTAVVKVFIKRPSIGHELVPQVLKWATEEIRDRAFIYWRLLSTDPVAAKAIVLGEKPTISTESEAIDQNLLDELCMYLASLASIYHKPAGNFIGSFHARKIIDSPALVKGRQFGNEELKFDNFQLTKYGRLTWVPGTNDNPYENALNAPSSNIFDFDAAQDSIFGGPTMQSVSVNNEYDDLESEKDTNLALNADQLDPLGILYNFPSISPRNEALDSHSYEIHDILEARSPSVSQQPKFPMHLVGGLSSEQSTEIDLNSSNPFLRNRQASGPSPFVPGNEASNDSEMTFGTKSGLTIDPFANFLSSSNANSVEYESAHVLEDHDPPLSADFQNRMNISVAVPIPSSVTMPFQYTTIPDSPYSTMNNQKLCMPLSRPSPLSIILTSANGNGLEVCGDYLQIALQTNIGSIIYFQMLVPLHVLFIEQGDISADSWISGWTGGPTEIVQMIDSSLGIEQATEALNPRNVFVVASRVIDDIPILYTSVKMSDGAVMLSEIRLDQALGKCEIATKTSVAHVAGEFHRTIEMLLIL